MLLHRLRAVLPDEGCLRGGNPSSAFTCFSHKRRSKAEGLASAHHVFVKAELASSSQSFDLGQARVQSESNSGKGWITANWVGCSPNAWTQSTGRKRHVSLCSAGSCSTRSNHGQPYPGRRVRAPWGW